MASCGLDRDTGLPLTDLDHVAQCVETIFGTRVGERVMLRWFGAGVAGLLGKRVTPRLLSAYRTLLAVAIATWEPRLQVVRIDAPGNTTDAVRFGDLRFRVLAYYRPRGHLGDPTIEGDLRGFTLAAADSRVTFQLE